MRRFIALVLLSGCIDDPVDESANECPDSVWLRDTDGDGFPGTVGDHASGCEPPEGYVSDEIPWDCNDLDPAIHDGAPEHCDGVDENCNNLVDDAPVEGFVYHADEDQDGFGSDEEASIVRSCEPLDLPLYLLDGGDCDDWDPDVNPIANETCNGVDDDCNGVFDDGMQTARFWLDEDQDGFGVPGEGAMACIQPVGWASASGDCSDRDATVNPGSLERCNGLDDDCDGTSDDETSDEDGDGYTVCSGDCDDRFAEAVPGGTEVCDGLDNDCDGVRNNPWADAFEPNNDRTTAPVVAEDGQTIVLHPTVSGPGDSDWFAMDTIDDPDNLFYSGDAFHASFRVWDLPPGVEASLHMYREVDLGAGGFRHVAVDDTWQDGVLEVERGGVWLSNDGNRYWAHLEVHAGYACDTSYSIELSNGG